jgi:hypothetical protein
MTKEVRIQWAGKHQTTRLIDSEPGYCIMLFEEEIPGLALPLGHEVDSEFYLIASGVGNLEPGQRQGSHGCQSDLFL